MSSPFNFKPCPFCRSDDIGMYATPCFGLDYDRFVICNGCGARGSKFDFDDGRHGGVKRSSLSEVIDLAEAAWNGPARAGSPGQGGDSHE